MPPPANTSKWKTISGRLLPPVNSLINNLNFLLKISANM